MNTRFLGQPTQSMFDNVDTFLTDDRMTQMWDTIRWFLSFNMPIIMTGVAICIAAAVIGVVIWIFTRKNPNDDDDPGYDIM